MRILVLTDMFPSPAAPYSGVFILELLKRLSGKAELTVVNPRPWFPWLAPRSGLAQRGAIPSREQRDGIEVFHPRQLAPPRGNRMVLASCTFFFSAWRLVRRSRRCREIDLIHAHAACPAGFAGVLLGRMLCRPVLVTVRGSDLNLYPRYPVLRQLVRVALKGADRVVAVSGPLRARAIELGASEHKVQVIRNGVDLKLFRPQDREVLQSRLGLKKGRAVIASIGNLVPVKGISFLLQAMSHLAGDRMPLTLLIVGDGYLATDLKAQASELGLTSRVSFVGPVPHPQIPDYLAAADLLVLPSLAEGSPNIVREALACGVPVVATAVGDVPELIDSQELGLLVPPSDPVALAGAIRAAISRTWDRGRLVAHARTFSWEETANAYLEVSERLVRDAAEQG